MNLGDSFNRVTPLSAVRTRHINLTTHFSGQCLPRRLLAGMAVASITLFAACNTSDAQSPIRDAVVKIQDVARSAEQTMRATGTVNLQVEAFAVERDEDLRKLQQIDDELQKALSGGANQDAEIDAQRRALEQKIQILTKMKEDSEFLSKKLYAHVEAFNITVANLRADQEESTKAAQANREADAAIARIQEIQRASRALGDQPQPGAPDFIEYMQKRIEIGKEFGRAKSRFEQAVADNITYNFLAENLSVSNEELAKWQVFIAKQTLAYEIDAIEMEGQISRFQSMLAMTDARRVFDDLLSYTVVEIKPIPRERMVLALPNLTIPEAPTIDWGSDIDAFDPARYRRELETQLRGGRR